MFQLHMPYWIMLLISGILTGIVFIFSMRSIQRQGAVALGVVMAASTAWSFCYAGELSSSMIEQAVFWAKLQYISIVTLAPAWLIFSVSLNGWKRFQRKIFYFLLFLIPLFILGSVWTNESHHLFWVKNVGNLIDGAFIMKNSYGPIFWIHFVYSYSLLTMGTLLLLYRFIVTDKIRRYRPIFILIPIVPMVANVVQFLGLNPIPSLDLTPFAFTITGIMLLWGSNMKFQVSFVPMNSDLVMEELREGVLITDEKGQVVEGNRAAKKMAEAEDLEGLQFFVEQYCRELMELAGSGQREIKTGKEDVTFLANCTVISSRSSIRGKLITFTDITKQKIAETEILERQKHFQLLSKITWDSMTRTDMSDMIGAFESSILEAYGDVKAKIWIFEKEKNGLVWRSDKEGEHDELYPFAERHGEDGELFISDSLKTNTDGEAGKTNSTIVSIPLREGKKSLGALVIDLKKHYKPSDLDINRMRQVGEQVALAVSRAYLLEKTQQLLKDTQSMNETLEMRIVERTKQLAKANESLHKAYDATIEGWAKALELRELETAGHCQRTVDMAVRLAIAVGIQGEKLIQVRRGALLHDIGKMVIPDEILRKKGPLTEEERRIIDTHPVIAKEVLGHIDYLRPATSIPYYHHEKWDGSGYPEGLCGEFIPLEARLFALVDVWDALSSNRYYRKALPPQLVIEEIRKGIGTHFDPQLAEIFLEIIEGDLMGD